MASGLDEFRSVLKDFKSLSGWTLGAGLGAPFLAALGSLAPPPWPKQITLVTAVMDLVVLVLVFQFFASSSRKRVNRTMAVAALVLAIVAVTYVFVFLRYTFVIPSDNSRIVKGFVCTEAAAVVFGEDCGDNPGEKLALMEYKPAKLWTTSSIDRITQTLAALWLLSFCALSTVIGLFIVFQRRQKRPAGAARHRRVGLR